MCIYTFRNSSRFVSQMIKLFYIFFRNTFKDCTSVQDLSLEANQISSLQDERTFSSMVSTLKTLDIGENLIAQFPDGIFSQHKELFGLRLAGNRLRNLTSLTFKGAENIRMLNLASNMLETIDQNCFSSLKHLKVGICYELKIASLISRIDIFLSFSLK